MNLEELKALLTLLGEHGVSQYETRELRLVLGAAKAAEFTDDPLSRLREQEEMDEEDVALAHVQAVRPRR